MPDSNTSNKTNNEKMRNGSSKRNVLFVGSFIRETGNGTMGGQMFACKTLVDSRLSNSIDWVLVDSTAELPEKPLPIRSIRAAQRVAMVCFHLTTKKIDTTLVFTAHGASFLEKGIICILARLRGCRTIIAPRSGLITNDLASTLRRKFIKLVFTKVSIVVCQSPHWKSTFESIAPHANYAIIHNWIAHTTHQGNIPAPGNTTLTNNCVQSASTLDSAHMEMEKSQTKSPVRLFFLGWVTKDKGIFELVDVVINLSQRYSLELHIGGHGDAFDEIRDKIRDSNADGFIKLHGWIGEEEKAAQFRKADIYIQPTHFEGFSNALLEAMNANVPAVCSDIPALSSLIEDNIHCLHFKVGNANSLASSLERLIDNPPLRATIADNANQLVQEKFSIEYGVEQFEKLL